MAEDRILDYLIPGRSKEPGSPAGFLLKTTDTASPDDPDQELRERTREKFREKLHRGELEEREIEIEVSQDQTPMLQVFGPMGLEEMGVNLQDLFGNMGGRRRKKRRVPISEARELLAQEEAQKLIDAHPSTQANFAYPGSVMPSRNRYGAQP